MGILARSQEERKRILLVVESPTKAKTLKNMVGQDYVIEASYGHIFDLPTDRLGVDIENGFIPEYQPLKGRGGTVERLKRAKQFAKEIYLGMDPDREGEAIAWALTEFIFGANGVKRVEFHEITRRAVNQALQHPRDLNQNLVEAQKARRILDRLVGYQISPLLWSKARKNAQRVLSAGRVQSATLKMVVERERKFQLFEPKPYWTLQVRFISAQDVEFSLYLMSEKDEPQAFSTYTELARICEALPSLEFSVSRVQKKEVEQYAPPPFITSTMQQEANRRLGFSPQRTMRVAQSLYEGVELGRGRREGLITYMRTDSVRISREALALARDWLKEHFPPEYVPSSPKYFRSRSQFAQEAHECIRPTSVSRTPDEIAPHLNEDQKKLYRLIWNRFVASQMAPARFELRTIWIAGGDLKFHGAKRTLIFDGYLRIWGVRETEEDDFAFPELQEKEKVRYVSHSVEKKLPSPPSRFTIASLIAEMEREGIGRPSTYAPTVDLLSRRAYIRQERKYLIPTLLGVAVTDFLVKSFPEIVDIPFTAKMEESLDAIEEGKGNRLNLLQEFYQKFSLLLEQAKNSNMTIRWAIETEEICPKCGGKLVLRESKMGRFLACSNYPNCRYARPEFLMESPFTCSECEQKLHYREYKRRQMLVCSCPQKNRWIPVGKAKPAGICPICGSPLKIQWDKKKRKWMTVCLQSDCEFQTPDFPAGKLCPRCGSTLFYFLPDRVVCWKVECEYEGERQSVCDWWRAGRL